MRDLIERLEGQLGEEIRQHPNWDGRKHKVMKVTGAVYHGTAKKMAEMLVSPKGPRHPGLKAKVRQWIGPIGFYVTKMLDRAKKYAVQHGVAKGEGKQDARVLEWDAAKLGLDEVLMVLHEPTHEDIEMAKGAKLSGIRGPGDWGILVFEPRAVAGKMVWKPD